MDGGEEVLEHAAGRLGAQRERHAQLHRSQQAPPPPRGGAQDRGPARRKAPASSAPQLAALVRLLGAAWPPGAASPVAWPRHDLGPSSRWPSVRLSSPLQLPRRPCRPRGVVTGPRGARGWRWASCRATSRPPSPSSRGTSSGHASCRPTSPPHSPSPSPLTLSPTSNHHAGRPRRHTHPHPHP